MRPSLGGRIVARLAGHPEELDPAVGITPGLARVVDGDRGRSVGAQVARMGRTRLREPDELEVLAPGEVGRVGVGGASRRDGRDRAEGRRLQEPPGRRRDPPRAEASV